VILQAVIRISTIHDEMSSFFWIARLDATILGRHPQHLPGRMRILAILLYASLQTQRIRAVDE
jgi:hypothetical protein